MFNPFYQLFKGPPIQNPLGTAKKKKKRQIRLGVVPVISFMQISLQCFRGFLLIN